MTQDHYAILGVAPGAPHGAIRAAYLSLMREYHPDRNPTQSATERAQAIIAAYKILGDFDRRQQYDWDRRRERDAAAALALAPKKRGVAPGLAAAGTIGLAAIGALLLRPAPQGDPAPARPALAEEVKAKIAPLQKGKAHRLAARSKEVKPAEERPPPEVRLASAAQGGAAQSAVVQVKASVAQMAPTPSKPKVAKPKAAQPKEEIVLASAAPATVAPRRKAVPAASPAIGGDLAALDQFVMSFYGQSWRFGDAKRRAALQQSRDDFVVRRGSCGADPCKRAAYLTFMRDVSVIVESGGAPR